MFSVLYRYASYNIIRPDFFLFQGPQPIRNLGAFDVSSKDMLRAVPCHLVLDRCGQILRKREKAASWQCGLLSPWEEFGFHG